MLGQDELSLTIGGANLACCRTIPDEEGDCVQGGHVLGSGKGVALFPDQEEHGIALLDIVVQLLKQGGRPLAEVLLVADFKALAP